MPFGQSIACSPFNCCGRAGKRGCGKRRVWPGGPRTRWPATGGSKTRWSRWNVAARLLSESLEQNRRDLERLPELGHGELLERYRQTVGRIQSLQQRAGEPGGLQATLRQALEDARQELDATIEAIRQVGGYEDFLLSPSFEKIRRAVTAAAPLVYLVTTPQGSLALIVAESVDQFFLWLDGFREEDLNHLLLEQADDEVTGGYLPGQLGRSDWLKASLEKVLPLLAEKLMGPVAERLRGAYRAVMEGVGTATRRL
jgi:hypothetical protein